MGAFPLAQCWAGGESRSAWISRILVSPISSFNSPPRLRKAGTLALGCTFPKDLLPWKSLRLCAHTQNQSLGGVFGPMSKSKHPQGFWKRLKPVAMGILIGAAVGSGSSAILWANEYIVNSSGHAIASNSSETLKIPENVSETIKEISEKNQLDNPIIVYQASQTERQWLVEPGMIGTFMGILFAVWGVGFVILNANINGIRAEVKEDHKVLSDKIDELIESQKRTPITTSQY